MWTFWSTVLVAALLVISGCTSDQPKAQKTTPTPTPTPTVTATPMVTVSKIIFADCTKQIAAGLPRNDADRVSRLQFSCGHLDVPQDYGVQFSASISLYVVKVHDTSQSKFQGSLIVNPGGPGESGVQLGISLALKVSLDLLDNYDIVGFDPRGVFLSDPVTCISNTQKDLISNTDADVRTEAGLAQAKAVYAPVGADCAAKYADKLGDYNTEFIARDLDLVRQGVGDEALNYLGYSYGTTVGAVYAHLFPTIVRTMVLDGASDPAADLFVSAEGQAASLEKTFDAFAADCIKQTACQAIGAPRAAVTALAAAADVAPIPSSRAGDTRLATGAIVRIASAAALFDPTKWSALGDAILSAQKGDSKQLFALVDAFTQRGDDGTYSNLLDANTAVTCNDRATPPSDAEVQALAADWAVKYPLFGLAQARQLLTCSNWNAVRHPVPAVTATGSPKILVLATINDPITPAAGATALAT
ncbi:MAG: Alpha/beta hydrolase fold, partial [Pseudonocardiales bacterium]|nr:Alpha/beta hydrolase fold [Pseudonocardiales bacterium]